MHSMMLLRSCLMVVTMFLGLEVPSYILLIIVKNLVLFDHKTFLQKAGLRLDGSWVVSEHLNFLLPEGDSLILLPEVVKVVTHKHKLH